MKKESNVGFCPKKEEFFLQRLDKSSRRVNLRQELETQLAEDFGLLEFTIKYRLDERGKIVDKLSGQEIVELTARGESKEETNSIIKIEKGLVSRPKDTWVHFSPKNEELGYPNNCVDFWRLVDGEVVWNRMVVSQDFNKLNNIREILSGEEKAVNETEILGLPIALDLKITEIFDYFEIGESKNMTTFEVIKNVVGEYMTVFSDEFGNKLSDNSDLIFRLYSICFKAIKNSKRNINRDMLEDYMYSVLSQQKQEKSFGCSATTTVGEFGEKIGYYVTSSGQVKFGEIPENFKECEHCGCWYSGDKCPFC